ncbi:hypothetical protein WICMUC_003896 [Wickerhamomyces mucosus]|uniref:Extracellular mutant protein 11 C-terminal domain-containing protein n=1 Tax=Wickerhamomyces mucosus TaxID=1378264 RepID=A0A9P8PIR9_9ASCO|nr:hypothetical protein WICMUC_003896 [Wickerhamomyces mucosus]
MHQSAKVKLEKDLSSAKKHVRIKAEPQIANNQPAEPYTATLNHFNKGSINKDPSTPSERIITSSDTIKNTNHNKIPSKFLLSTTNLELLDKNYEETTLEDTPTKKRSHSKENKTQFPTKKAKSTSTSVLNPPKQDIIMSNKQTNKSAVEKYTVQQPIDPIDCLPLENYHSSTPIQVKSSTVKKPPPPFNPIVESLIENGNDFINFDNVFNNIDDMVTKQQYLKSANLDFNDWISQGVKIIDKQHDLVKKIILIRSKANLKFGYIFKLINNYSLSLEDKDKELKGKMNKLQKLGEEIKSFIQ